MFQVTADQGHNRMRQSDFEAYSFSCLYVEVVRIMDDHSSFDHLPRKRLNNE